MNKMNRDKTGNRIAEPRASWGDVIDRAAKIGEMPPANSSDFSKSYPEARARVAAALESRGSMLLPEEIVVPFRVSTEKRATDGHVVLSGGWDLDTRFRKNPVCLYMHSRWDPIGKIPVVEVRDGALYADIVFPAKHIDAMAHDIGLKVLHGYLNAVSVGFVPLEMQDDPTATEEEKKKFFDPWSQKGPQRITKAMLIEISVVTLPADEDAVGDRSIGRYGKDRDRKGAEKCGCKDRKNNRAEGDMVDPNNSPDDIPLEEQAASKVDTCVADKIAKLIAEGKTQEQAAAIAYSMCGKGKRMSADAKASIMAAVIAIESALAVVGENLAVAKAEIEAQEVGEDQSGEGEPATAEGEPVPEGAPMEDGEREMTTISTLELESLNRALKRLHDRLS